MKVARRHAMGKEGREVPTQLIILRHLSDPMMGCGVNQWLAMVMKMLIL